MENRFKIKAWDKINQEMFEEIYLDEKCINCKVGNGWINRNYEDCIVIQSTGLRDKNGKLIFEADILKIKDKNYQIIWDKDCLQYFLERDGFKFCWSDCFDEKKRKFIIEIIGNIYENSELIGE